MGRDNVEVRRLVPALGERVFHYGMEMVGGMKWER